MAQFCSSFEVDSTRLGWQKFDLTATVREWYSRREADKLRLLIDCSGCGKLYTLHLFNDNSVPETGSTRSRRVANDRRNTKISIKSNNENLYNVTSNDEIYNKFQYNTYNQTISNGLASSTIVVSSENQDEVIKETEPKADDKDALNSSRPFLVLHTEARRPRRVRRRAINCNGALHGQCCKESFYVSFKALGWDDWIIAPRGYFANYCRGDCTGPYRTPDTFQTFHAHFIEEYRKMGLLNGMQPCCAPIKFSSMSLIYYGDDGIIKRDLPKMVVDECGCP